jgi:hypothetical protein
MYQLTHTKSVAEIPGRFIKYSSLIFGRSSEWLADMYVFPPWLCHIYAVAYDATGFELRNRLFCFLVKLLETNSLSKWTQFEILWFDYT